MRVLYIFWRRKNGCKLWTWTLVALEGLGGKSTIGVSKRARFRHLWICEPRSRGLGPTQFDGVRNNIGGGAVWIAYGSGVGDISGGVRWGENGCGAIDCFSSGL